MSLNSCVLPSTIATMVTDSELGEGSLLNILQLYKNDIPTFDAELDSWSQKWIAAELNTPERALVVC